VLGSVRPSFARKGASVGPKKIENLQSYTCVHLKYMAHWDERLEPIYQTENPNFLE